MTDANLRDLIQRMADELDHYRQLLMDDRREAHALAVEARAALAKPEPEGPTDEELEATARAAEIQYSKEHGGLAATTPDGIHTQLQAQRLAGLRAVAARWGK